MPPPPEIAHGGTPCSSSLPKNLLTPQQTHPHPGEPEPRHLLTVSELLSPGPGTIHILTFVEENRVFNCEQEVAPLGSL